MNVCARVQHTHTHTHTFLDSIFASWISIYCKTVHVCVRANSPLIVFIYFALSVSARVCLCRQNTIHKWADQQNMRNNNICIRKNRTAQREQTQMPYAYAAHTEYTCSNRFVCALRRWQPKHIVTSNTQTIWYTCISSERVSERERE